MTGSGDCTVQSFQRESGGCVGGEMKYHFPPTGFEAPKRNEKKKIKKLPFSRRLLCCCCEK
jgi:hypothetical protein